MDNDNNSTTVLLLIIMIVKETYVILCNNSEHLCIYIYRCKHLDCMWTTPSML